MNDLLLTEDRHNRVVGTMSSGSIDRPNGVPSKAIATYKRVLWRFLRFEGLDDEGTGIILWAALVLAVGAVILRFFFWWYTGRMWEDALITVLHSENFVNGLGMTHYRVGEPPLHGFTSPLSVLVPLMGDLVKVGFGLHWIRILSAFCGGLTVLYAMAICIHPKIKLPAPLAIMIMAYLAFEHHQILWGMAGMETQMVTLVLLMSVYYTIALKPVALGLSLGLCMLARPDFAPWTAIAGLYVLIVDWRKLFIIIPVAAAVYGPWIIFTTLYYGSPLPNTIIAKSLGYPLWTKNPNLTWKGVWMEIYRRMTGSYGYSTIFQPLGPSFAGHGTGFRAIIRDRGLICDTMIALALLGSIVPVFKRQWAWLPAICFVWLYAAYYVFLVAGVFGWYVVPYVAAVIFLSARGLQSVGGVIRYSRVRTAVWSVVAVAYLAPLVGVLPLTFRTEKQIQELIENSVRKQIGLYLSGVMGKDETIGCEPLGYIGYYSRRTVYDWPGLASRRVVEFSKANPQKRREIHMLNALRPDYIVLRNRAYDYYITHGRTWLMTDYHPVAQFDADPERLRHIFLIDQNIDQHFLVLKKRTPGADQTTK